MKFRSVQDLREKSGSVWKDLKKEQEMVITDKGRPIAVLSVTSEDDFEQTITTLRRTRAQNAISTLQQNSLKKGLDRISLKEIDREIQDSRITRR